MNARRWLSLAGFGLMLFGSAHAPMAAPDGWTPDRVRAFVLRVESEMIQLATEQLNANLFSLGTCRGFAIGPAIKKSVAMPRIQALVTGKVLTCYVASYLGCSTGEWIARPSQFVTIRSPFSRSKVTIIEQTADRVVADVTEASYLDLGDFVAGVALGDDDETRPFTDAEVAAVKDSSRYTITRGNDGVWRISDRKPSFKWICQDSSVRARRK